jgi:hypothetical protein
LSSAALGHTTIVASDFWVAFLGIALLSMISPLWHRRLAPDAGMEVSGHVKL